MKKWIVLGWMCLAALGARAQWGVQVGATFTNLKLSDVAMSKDFLSTRTGFSAGITYDFKVIWGLGVNTGLLFVQRNVKERAPEVGGEVEMDFVNRYSSIEIPVNLKYTFRMLPVVKPFVMAGVYFDCGVGATERDQKVTYGETLNRLGSGLLLGAGADLLGHLRVMYQYDLGLSDLVPDSWSNIKTMNRGHRLSVGVFF